MFKQGDIIVTKAANYTGSVFYEVVMMFQPYPNYPVQVACTRFDDPRPSGYKEIYYFNPENVELYEADVPTEGITQLNEPVVNDMVKHPSHYTAGGIETREFIKAKLNAMPHLTPWQAYCIGTAMKYPTRAGLKDIAKFKEDLKKAITYLEWAIEDEA